MPSNIVTAGRASLTWAAKAKVLVDGAIILEGGRIRREANQLIERGFLRKHKLELLDRRLRWAPFHHVDDGGLWHSRDQLRSPTNGNEPRTCEKVPTPVVHGMEDAHIGKGILKRTRNGGKYCIIAPRQPLLEYTARAQMLLDQRIEILRVEKAGASSRHGRRRINNDGIVAPGEALQITPPIVNHHVCQWRCQHLGAVRMIVSE